MTRRGASRGSLATAVLGLTAVLSAAPSAYGSPDLLLDGEEREASGTVRYRVVRLLNGSRLVVKPFAGAGTDTGRLEVIAHRILIDATSAIDASGAGFRGVANADGEGNGGGKGATVSTDATGGGGHGARGGQGVLRSGCSPIAGALGGDVAVAGPSDVTFGGAGSAAGTADGDDGGEGGKGGGAILLRASRIEVDGLVQTNGTPGLVFNDDAAGGGAGGGLLVQASTFLAFGGTLRADGAPGGLTSKDEGGGGGGGELRLLIPAIPGNLAISLAAGGGVSCALAAGENTPIPPAVAPGCLDLDGDGFQSSECGGIDCDDSDAQVHWGAQERCNGEDDDCSGEVDDHGAAQSCGGSSCSEGACVPPADAGQDGDGTDALEGDAAATDAQVTEGGQDAAADAGGDARPGNASEEQGASEAKTSLRGGCSARGTEHAAGGGWLAMVLAVGGLAAGVRANRAPIQPVERSSVT